MKKIIITLTSIALACVSFAEWKPAGDNLKTKWASEINPNAPLPEYPRPQLERAQWLNLNGLWDYAIVKKDSPTPQNFDGKILVPFPVESSLSGVQKTLTKDQNLWYKRTFTIPQDWKGKNILINFGAVDWKAEVFVNGNHAGTHTGGYAPFSFDITELLVDGENSITVKVWDPTDADILNPTGKQTMNPGGCHYTAVSGIWQTVWLEPVSPIYIKNLFITPNLDCSRFEVLAKSNCPATSIEVKVFDNGKEVAKSKAKICKPAYLEIVNPKLWSPESPFLYDMEVSLIKNGKVVDTVKSYSAMRKFSTDKMTRSPRGVKWAMLNNKKIYMFGPLDQGWWPDGLYTAPTDEALKYDIVKTKDWGFNIIRKHIKVEPARWYYHCDKLGMIVWQDIPSCHRPYTTPWVVTNFAPEDAKIIENDEYEAYRAHAPVNEFKVVTRRDVDNFYKEMTEIVEALYSFPCISVWVPFNENWGQFDTINVVKAMRKLDSTRLINAASGGNYFQCGDIIGIHSYPNPRILFMSRNYINMMDEYGGLPIDPAQNSWKSKVKGWGYTAARSPEETFKAYSEYIETLKGMIDDGIVGAVYTQTTDVEIEINGIMTYNRIFKFPDEQKLRQVNQSLIKHAEQTK